MIKMKALASIVLILLLIAVSAPPVFAGPLTVENYSFELPGDVKHHNWELVPGWSSDFVAADSGVESESGTVGDWAGFLMATTLGDPSVWQLTGHTIAAGEDFTLLADMTNTGGGGTTAQMSLYYDDGGVRTVAATQQVTFAGYHVWEEYSLTFSADSLPASIGNQIGIEISNDTGWMGIDNVRLETLGPSIAPALIAPLSGDPLQEWDLDLEWLAPEAYPTSDYWVYLDPNEANVTAATEGSDPGAPEDPLDLRVLDSDPNYYVAGPLDNDTTYYWKVEAKWTPIDPPGDPNWIPSAVGSFTTLPDEPVITLEPDPCTLPDGGTVTFTVEAVNATAYKWYHAPTPYENDLGTPVPGGTNPSLTISPVIEAAHEGYYYCRVSNAADYRDSRKVLLMTERLFAQWSFENTINSEVVSGKIFTGTYIDPNDPIPDPDFDNTEPSPAGGYAIKFDGDTTESEGNDEGEFIEVSEPNVFNFYPQGVTASAWVKITGPGTTGWGAIACKQDRPSNGWVLQKNSASGVFTMRPAGDLQGDTDLDTVNEDLGNTWHLVTGTCDGETLRVYIDGALENEAAAPTMATHSVPVLIGAETPTGFSPLEGLIDDVQIYTYAKSRVEVAVLYTSQVPGASVCVEDLANIEFDFNNDCTTDLKDLAEFAAYWLECYIVPTCIP